MVRLAFRLSARLYRQTMCSRNSSNNEKTTTFGFEEVTEAEKAKKVQSTFNSVAGSYDLMNDLMSFGIHRFWKDYFVQQLDLPGNTRVLDVAGGTGDLALRMKGYKNRLKDEGDIDVTVLDINNDMLSEGMKKDGGDDIKWVHGDAMELPFPDNSFDVYTIAFGIRNVANIQKVLNEALRVLVPGGQFVCMEFTTVTNPLVRKLYDTYSFQIIPVVGELIAKDRDAYQYLVESIRNFPKKEEFAQMMRDCGMCNVRYELLTAGIVAIHTGFKHCSLIKNSDKQSKTL